MLFARTNRTGMNGVSATGLRGLGAQDAPGWKSGNYVPPYSQYPSCDSVNYQPGFDSQFRCVGADSQGNPLVYDKSSNPAVYQVNVDAKPCNLPGQPADVHCSYTAMDGSGAVYDNNDVQYPQSQSNPIGCANPVWNAAFERWDCSDFTQKLYAAACGLTPPVAIFWDGRLQNGHPLSSASPVDVTNDPAFAPGGPGWNATGKTGMRFPNGVPGCPSYTGAQAPQATPPAYTPVLQSNISPRTAAAAIVSGGNAPGGVPNGTQVITGNSVSPQVQAVQPQIQIDYGPNQSGQPTSNLSAAQILAMQQQIAALQQAQQAQQQVLVPSASNLATGNVPSTVVTPTGDTMLGPIDVTSIENWVQQNMVLAAVGVAALLFLGSRH